MKKHPPEYYIGKIIYVKVDRLKNTYTSEDEGFYVVIGIKYSNLKSCEDYTELITIGPYNMLWYDFITKYPDEHIVLG